ncbi:MAG: hypothetical protein WCP16_00610 [Pseudanabaena sp. ELA645]|jgi:hypothetical protein
MDNNSQIKFSWGTFCRRAITDQNTGEMSIIDVVPALEVEQVVPLNVNSDDLKVPIPLGTMYLTSVFKRLDDSDNEISEDLSIEFSQTGLPSVLIEVKAFMRSTDSSVFINLDLQGLLLIVTSLDVSRYSFEVVYRVRDQELGRLILPVVVKFKLLNDE